MMPWSRDNLPDSVKNKNYGEHQVTVFIAAANNALKEYGDDGRAIATGIAAADKADEKSNASRWPVRFFAKHMQPGVCGYGTETVLVDTDAMKKMIGNDAIGKPIYVLHNSAPNDERLAKLREEAEGYIIDSFYNELDGWAWFECLATGDGAHQALARGWSVSNAYLPTKWDKGGTKNNVPFDREVMDGVYTHLALVPDPRYEDACIMTPEQFGQYQDSKKRQLEELRNSKSSEEKKMFKLFNRDRKPATADSITAETEVELDDGKTVTIGEMMNALKADKAKTEEEKKNAKAKKNEKDNDEDEKEEKEKAERENAARAKKNSEKMNEDTEVSVDGETMPMKELMSRYNACMKKNAAESEANKKKDAEEESGEEGDKKNRKEKKNSLADEEAANDHFRELQNAAHKGNPPAQKLETSIDRLQRGKDRYGSGR